MTLVISWNSKDGKSSINTQKHHKARISKRNHNSPIESKLSFALEYVHTILSSSQLRKQRKEEKRKHRNNQRTGAGFPLRKLQSLPNISTRCKHHSVSKHFTHTTSHHIDKWKRQMKKIKKIPFYPKSVPSPYCTIELTPNSNMAGCGVTQRYKTKEIEGKNKSRSPV